MEPKIETKNKRQLLPNVHDHSNKPRARPSFEAIAPVLTGGLSVLWGTPLSDSQRNFFQAFSGLVSRTMVAPFERLIILAQTKNASELGSKARQSVFETLLAIYRQQGIRGLFQSNGVNCLRIAPQTAIEFLAFDHAKTWAKDASQFLEVPLPDQIRNLMAGSLAGMIAFAAVNS